MIWTRPTAEYVAQRAVVWTLRLAMVIQAFGIAARYLFTRFEQESDVYSTLFFDWGWSEQSALLFEDAATWTMLVSAILLLAFPMLEAVLRYASSGYIPTLPSPVWQPPVLVIVIGWIAALALGGMWRGGEYSWWIPGEWAVRFAAPTGLLLLMTWRRGAEAGEARMTDVVSLLRWAAAITFVVHGWKAIEHFPPFVDLLLGSARQIGWNGLTQQQAELALSIIGALDVLAAFLLVTTRWRIVPCYMALWGFVTAASRITEAGAGNYAESLLRAANGGVPLAILLYWHLRPTKTPAASEDVSGESTAS